MTVKDRNVQVNLVVHSTLQEQKRPNIKFSVIQYILTLWKKHKCVHLSLGSFEIV